MAITEVFTYSLRPGGTEQFLVLAKRADKILRALGATTRTLTNVAGGPPNSFVYLVETPNWKAYGELSARLDNDPEWRKFLADMTSNEKPPVDLVSSAIYAEIPLG